MNDKLPKGFIRASKRNARGGVYRGILTCAGVQWAGSERDRLATFTMTAEEIADAAITQRLWTDQDVQRGIRPECDNSTPRLLSLSEGYPDASKYIFNADNADDIVDKLHSGETIFLSPLVWNLRPGTFAAYWDEESQSIFLYEGKIFLPDSHHRQQAIAKAVRLWREDPRQFPNFSGEREFKVELYFLSKEDEGNYFFDKNQLPRPTAKSKAYDLTTRDDLSLLAKQIASQSSALDQNVNRVTDRLTARNPQVVTLSTLREMARIIAPSSALGSEEVEGLAKQFAEFIDILAAVRTELAKVDISERRRVRTHSLVDSAVMMHGYAHLAKHYLDLSASVGAVAAMNKARIDLVRLSSSNCYEYEDWNGDLFSKSNPLWLKIGVLKRARKGSALTVINTGGSRSECGRVLMQVVTTKNQVSSLEFLATT